MKFFICFFVLCFVLFNSFGCNFAWNSPTMETPIPTEMDSWYNNIKITCPEWTVPILKYAENIYYISNSGIFMEKGSIQEQIVEQNNITGLYTYENKLYYCTENEINCFDFQSKIVNNIWHAGMLPAEEFKYFDGIYGFQIYKNYLYIKDSGISVFRVNLNTLETEPFLKDYSSLAFLEDKCYYIEHVQRSFSIFEMDIKTKKIQLVRGDGLTADESKEIRYDNVVALNNELYYSIRELNRIYKYQEEGADPYIIDFSNDENAFLAFDIESYNDRLYYVIRNDKNDSLYEYDPQTGIEKLLFTQKRLYLKFFILESLLFYIDNKDGNIKCVHI